MNANLSIGSAFPDFQPLFGAHNWLMQKSAPRFDKLLILDHITMQSLWWGKNSLSSCPPLPTLSAAPLNWLWNKESMGGGLLGSKDKWPPAQATGRPRGCQLPWGQSSSSITSCGSLLLETCQAQEKGLRRMPPLRPLQQAKICMNYFSVLSFG